MKNTIKNLLAGSCFFLCLGSLRANPVDVSYTVNGSSGNYTLDFSVTNNTTAGMDIYFFGVLLSASGITNYPTGYLNQQPTWTNAPYGGSSLVYNNNWNDGPLATYNHLGLGQTLSGFTVHITDLIAPGSVNFFAAGYSPGGTVLYEGANGYFGAKHNNPFFEDVATNSSGTSVPDAGATVALLGGALLGLAAFRRRFVAYPV